MNNEKTTQIHEAEKRLTRAISQKDVATLEELLHDDLLFILPSGQAITKEMDLSVYRSGEFDIIKIESTIERVNIIEDTAVATVVNEVHGKMSGQEFQGHFRYIRVWKNFDGKWKVIGGSGISISV